jgi:uncharacterized protein
MQDKLDTLRGLLAQMQSVVIAYSGGVDSSLLLKVAYDVLGNAAVAVTIDSPSQPRAELAEAQTLAKSLGVRHVLMQSSEMDDPLYLANTPERCYFCKRRICAALLDFARTNGFAHVADGGNVDDLRDFRPGERATREFGLRHPLQEAGLTKVEIRSLAHSLGLPNWSKPSAACLSSRLPYGDAITKEKLQQIEQAEAFLHNQGFAQVRVRYHGAVARVELAADDLLRAIELRETIVGALRAAGFKYVTLDLAGFRSGSMNEVLGESWTKRS